MIRLITVMMLVSFLTSCNASRQHVAAHPRKTPTKNPPANTATAKTPPTKVPTRSPVKTVTRWHRVTDPSALILTAVAAAEAIDRKGSAKPLNPDGSASWIYQGVEPQIYFSDEGQYRVIWFWDDPNRDTWPYTWYDISSDGSVGGGAGSAIPGSLIAPDVMLIPDW